MRWFTRKQIVHNFHRGEVMKMERRQLYTDAKDVKWAKSNKAENKTTTH